MPSVYIVFFFVCQCLSPDFCFNAMSFAVQSSVCPPVPLSPCLPVHVGYVQCVGVVRVAVCCCVCGCVVLCCVVCCCVLLCVLCCVVCVCRTHSQDHGIHMHTDVHVGVTVFCSLTFHNGFMFFCFLTVSSIFRDFKLH